ncbi:cholesterol transporter ABCA5-like isoform X1 [Schistocerca cancellata]|uniref:cholesterol transporter ABCA5-like isoform X1 n=1 Tax=Schistocerca cancellata TaxID=274614 RepID=UPI0021194A93|nr:cholesterol transporter ABCA5-like isoform X1 [Schistocerca cancellata]
MGERTSTYFSQLKAMIIRNLLLKKREKRKTIAEVFLPLYSLGILIIIKIMIPNPNFPIMNTPRGDATLFEHFQLSKNHSVAIVPNTSETQAFVDAVNQLWLNMHLDRGLHPINFMLFETMEDLLTAYWLEPTSIPVAVIFDSDDPIKGRLTYQIRTNPSFVVTPSTTELYSSPASCRDSGNSWGGVFPIETGDSCPVNQYYYSGFVAIQALFDYTKIRLDSNRKDISVPHILLELFPKEAYTGDWMVAFRVVIPLYMVMALSQFITYLLILIVGEKENKIKEGMKIMGLRDSVFWLSWFIIYGAFVLVLTIISTVLLFTLKVFQHTSYLLVFLLILLYSLSIIMFGFMLTPFFDKSRTAGILGNFAVNIMSLLYFIQVFVDDSSSIAFWVVSLISSTGFALAMDKALVLDLSGDGVTFDNLWSGPGIPFGGSLIMMALDIVLYGFLAYYLDCVIPSEHGTKRSPWFCLTPGFWFSKKATPHVSSVNGESGSFNAADESSQDIEPVAREMKGKEAIKIVDLFKTFQACRKPEVKAVNGINLTIYEGQITAILGHNGAGKTTLFNILTGLTAPTAGTAFVFGYDIRDPNDMHTIRRMTGVCPQHDILFDLLTPREHLEFFAAVRGIPSSLIDFEVTKTLRDIDLVDKADTFAKHLSGGQKRKLSVGIAVIGDPKIIILDEPTAGVDPYSRRHMWSVLQNRRHGKVILLTTHFMDEADILADRKAVVSKGRLRCCGSSLFLKNKFGIGYHLTLVLEGVAREHAITRLVTSHVPKAEKARRHGRELSFILPHNAVDNFAPLFSAIEQEISTRASRLGISSYGVSMTTLEEVFLHLERDEETDCTMDNLSKKMVRNRALSRSLSLQSKSTSYQSLQNEGGILTTGITDFPGKMCTETQMDGNINQETHLIPGLGFEPIETKPNTLQILIALLKLRILRMVRDIQKLYFMIILPLGFAALGLYLNSIQTIEAKMKLLDLGGDTYEGNRKFVVHNATSEDLDEFIQNLEISGATSVEMYNGNFSLLLDIAPHMAAMNVNTYDIPQLSLTVIYNDTAQHSLPIIMNTISNAFYKMVMASVNDVDVQPIVVKTHPFQQTSQPEEFNMGTFSSALFIGMIFVLVPVSLAVDMVYDREIKAKNQLRVNGLSFFMYFFTYFLVLIGLMLFICGALLALIFVFDLPSLREPPAFCTLGALIILYCPASILFATCVSYIFDKMDSAQSILPNIATFLGLIPFILVMFLDMFRIGGRAALALHVVFSLLNTMYIPYAVVYFVDRVHLMCSVNSACNYLTVGDYLTEEVIVMLVGILLHIPFWFFVLLILDVRKSGGRTSDVFKYLFEKSLYGNEDDEINVTSGAHGKSCKIQIAQCVSGKKMSKLSCFDKFPQDRMKEGKRAGGKEEAAHIPLTAASSPMNHDRKTSEEVTENSDIGEHEDNDVKAERQKVADIMASNITKPPVVIVQNLRKEYHKKELKMCTCSLCCPKEEEEDVHVKIAVRNLSLAVDAGEVFGLLGHNGAGKTTTMKIMIAEEAATKGRVQIGGHNITSNIAEAFQLMGYCPQHDAQWKNITVREHLECYAAIRGVPPEDIQRVVDMYLMGLQIHEHANKQSQHCSGGTRRKLSFAMAMVGGPCVVLMDEPSTGMDPRSKRFLWDTILASFQGTRGAILTTHSMEEADALCSRVGIMVKGELRCIGSTQHLKNLYGAGYTLEMKLRGGDRTPTTPSSDRHSDLREFVNGLFPDASLEESFADRLVFSVPQHAVTSLAECFTQLEKAKQELDIEEYSFSQTTLEQVFLKFGHYDEVNGD